MRNNRLDTDFLRSQKDDQVNLISQMSTQNIQRRKQCLAHPLEWKKAVQSYSEIIMRHLLIEKQRRGLESLREKIYSEGITKKIQKINSQIDQINAKYFANGRSSLPLMGKRSLEEIRQKMQKQKNEKIKKEESKIMEEIDFLESSIKIQENK